MAAVTAQHLVGFSTLARPGPLCNTKSHFNHDLSSGNLRAFNLKKLKLLLSPSLQWPQAALRLGGDIPETSRSSVKTCTWAILLAEEAQCSLGANLNGASRLLLNCPSDRQVS